MIIINIRSSNDRYSLVFEILYNQHFTSTIGVMNFIIRRI